MGHPQEITKALEGLGSSIHEIAGIPKDATARARGSTWARPSRSCRSAPATRELSAANKAVEEAIAAAESAATPGAARRHAAGASRPPPPPRGPSRLARGAAHGVSGLEIAAILLAGVAAGTINTVVGSGTLITFPTLLAFGVPPVTANVSNTVGLVPGSVSGCDRLPPRARRPARPAAAAGSASAAGWPAGAVLLLRLPPRRSTRSCPVLVGLGVLLVVLGPAISRRVAARAERAHGPPEHGAPWVWPAVLLAGVYGGYFGAAQGVLLMAILGIGVADTPAAPNATKNVLAGIVNAVAPCSSSWSPTSTGRSRD